MGWVKAQIKDNKPATNRNQKADELARIRKIKTEDMQGTKWTIKWLHQKLGHTGREALYFAAQSQGWPLNRKSM